MSNYFGGILTATNKPYGDNARKGAVRDRFQVSHELRVELFERFSRFIIHVNIDLPVG